jgi:hypothetical protein
VHPAEKHQVLELYAVLQHVHKEQLGPPGTSFVYHMDNYALRRNTGVFMESYEFARALTMLQAMGAFTAKQHPPEIFITLEVPSHKFDVVIHQPKFDDLLNDFAYAVNEQDKTAPSSPPQKLNGGVELRLVKDGTYLLLRGPQGDTLINNFRDGMRPTLLLSYLLHHEGVTVTTQQMRNDTAGLDTVSDIGDMLRKAGFTATLKQIFMQVRGKKRAQLQTRATATAAQYQQVMDELRRRKPPEISGNQNSSK